MSRLKLVAQIINRGSAFSTQNFMDAVKYIPNKILPERRKKRAYLSSILSKNEMDKEGAYNRKLFYRVKRGNYVFNPNLSLKIENEWINIYDLLSFMKLSHQHQKKQERWWNVNDDYDNVLEHNKGVIESLIADKVRK